MREWEWGGGADGENVQVDSAPNREPGTGLDPRIHAITT